MSLQNWANAGWLRAHQATAKQVTAQFALVKRDPRDAAGDVSADWQFNIAYNAALQLCTILLHASGWRAEKNLAHYRTLQSLPLILGPEWQDGADYFDTCRTKRKQTEYDAAGRITRDEARELAGFAHELRQGVAAWLQKEHPELLP